MLSVYIHIPFCERKCSYCGFYSTGYKAAAADAYIDALEIETERYRDQLTGRMVQSIYVGGGTPTMLSEQQLARLLHMVNGRISADRERELTVEANPDSASHRKLLLLRDLGVTRLSLGVQSFSDHELARLGRPHRSWQAEQAYRNARQAGFASVSMDLIYGLPGQCREDWERTLRRAVALGPDHLSLYGLSIDDGSRFAADVRNGSMIAPDDDRAAGMYEGSLEILDRAGYRQYEVSSFARPSHHVCRHNDHYWNRGEYLGLGASAWSFLGDRRRQNIVDADGYRERMGWGESVIAQEEVISGEQAAAEALILGLRRAAGVDLALSLERFPEQDRSGILQRISTLCGDGLFEGRQGRLRFTTRGQLLSNEALARLLP